MSETKQETESARVPFMAHLYEQAKTLGASPEILALFDKATVYIGGCESTRDQVQERCRATEVERDNATTALVHMTGQHKELDDALAVLRANALHRTVLNGDKHFHTGVPMGEGAEWVTVDELNALVTHRRALVNTRSMLTGKIERMAQALRWAEHRCTFPAGEDRPAGFKEVQERP